MSHQVVIDRAAAKDLHGLDRPVRDRVISSIAALAEEPFPPSARPLTGYPNYYRVRVGDYRIVYAIDNGKLIVAVAGIGHRSKIYELLKRRT